VEAALESWPREVEGLRRFAGQRWDEADRPSPSSLMRVH
jgi:hypothetical protein